MPLAEQRIVERRQEDRFDELLHQPTAPAVRQQHLWMLLDRERADGLEVGRLHSTFFRHS
jgi:hypothetical protein